MYFAELPELVASHVCESHYLFAEYVALVEGPELARRFRMRT
jgi:hypothetical protein